MFLADERGCMQNECYRTYQTFNTANFFNQHKQAFNGLHLLNDNTLAAGHSIATEADEGSITFLLPVVGSLCLKNALQNEQLLSPGQLHFFINNSGFKVSNIHSGGLINYIQFSVKASSEVGGLESKHSSFDVAKNRDQLIELTQSATAAPKILIGKFAGRKEADYELKSPESSLFVFVLEGAFEVQGRLLHAKDGLALWNGPQHFELEALSNEAIVLIIELNPKTNN